MKLRAGDMVTPGQLTTDVIQLFNSPPGPLFHGESPVSSLNRGDHAVVVALDRHDGRCVYVVGPHGAGWTFGGFLARIDVTDG